MTGMGGKRTLAGLGHAHALHPVGLPGLSGVCLPNVQAPGSMHISANANGTIKFCLM